MKKKSYSYKLDKYSAMSIVFPIILVLLSSFILGLTGRHYVKSEYTGYLLIICII